MVVAQAKEEVVELQVVPRGHLVRVVAVVAPGDQEAGPLKTLLPLRPIHPPRRLPLVVSATFGAVLTTM